MNEHRRQWRVRKMFRWLWWAVTDFWGLLNLGGTSVLKCGHGYLGRVLLDHSNLSIGRSQKFKSGTQTVPNSRVRPSPAHCESSLRLCAESSGALWGCCDSEELLALLTAERSDDRENFCRCCSPAYKSLILNGLKYSIIKLGSCLKTVRCTEKLSSMPLNSNDW